MRGPNVFAGYWRRPDATAAAFVDGWFRTGDLAERSADGYFTLRGRRSDLIISGGFNIYPREIEELLLEHPGFARPRSSACRTRAGEKCRWPTSWPTGPSTCRRWSSCAAASLASFKVPRGFVRVDALPRTALGKVQKHLLPPWRP